MKWAKICESDTALTVVVAIFEGIQVCIKGGSRKSLSSRVLSPAAAVSSTTSGD